MKIGELAQQTGLSASAIRYYESKGLLQAVGRQSNGYRDYPPQMVGLLSIIVNAQKAGFSLEDIRQLLPGDAAGWKHDRLVGALQTKIAELEAMEAKILESKSRLLQVVSLIESKPNDMDCRDNAVRVLRAMGLQST